MIILSATALAVAVAITVAVCVIAVIGAVVVAVCGSAIAIRLQPCPAVAIAVAITSGVCGAIGESTNAVKIARVSLRCAAVNYAITLPRHIQRAVCRHIISSEPRQAINGSNVISGKPLHVATKPIKAASSVAGGSDLGVDVRD